MKYLSILIIAAALASLTSCQTMQGIGRDVESAGNGLEQAASR